MTTISSATTMIDPPFERDAFDEARGLAASTIDRRLSTVCGFYRFAHIDGRIASDPAQYVRRPQVHPSDSRGLDRSGSRRRGIGLRSHPTSTPSPPRSELTDLSSVGCR